MFVQNYLGYFGDIYPSSFSVFIITLFLVSLRVETKKPFVPTVDVLMTWWGQCRGRRSRRCSSNELVVAFCEGRWIKTLELTFKHVWYLDEERQNNQTPFLPETRYFKAMSTNSLQVLVFSSLMIPLLGLRLYETHSSALGSCPVKEERIHTREIQERAQ